jgi:hypothetical protein
MGMRQRRCPCCKKLRRFVEGGADNDIAQRGKKWRKVITVDTINGEISFITLAWNCGTWWCFMCTTDLRLHPNAGKIRCAQCEHIWKPRGPTNPLPKCPSCGETEDVFYADDGGWETAALERGFPSARSRRSPE